MSTSANFPSTLYATTSVTLDAVLIQDEWTQVAVEIEAVEKTLGANPQGTAATVVARLNALGSGGISAFSSLTGTFTAAQHGDLSGSSAGAHGFTSLTGTITAAQHAALTGTAAGHPFSSLTGTFTAAQHGGLGTAALHPVSGLSNTFTIKKANSAAYFITSAIVDVPGFQIALDTPGTYLVLYKGDLTVGSSGVGFSVSQYVVNSAGAQLSGPNVTLISSANLVNTRIPTTEVVLITTTADSQIVKVQAEGGTAGSNSQVVNSVSSWLLGLRVQ